MKKINLLTAVVVLASTVLASQASAYAEARLNKRVRAAESISLTRVLGLDRWQGYEIDTIEINGRADRRTVDLNLFYDREEIGRSYLQSPYGENVPVYPRYRTIVRRGGELRLDVRGEGVIDTVAVRFRGGNNPNPPPRPPPGHPGDDYVQLQCFSIIKPLITECKVEGRILSVRLVREHSSNDCEYGRTWYYSSDRISVTKGCKATFEARIRR